MAAPLPPVVIPAAVLGDVRVADVRLAEPRVQPEPLDVATLYRSHGAAVARWVARLAGPGLEPEDLVQEVFLIAQRKLPGFRGESSPARWLYRIAERVVWHRRRKQRQQEPSRSRWHRLFFAGRAGVAEIEPADLPSPDPSPLDVVQTRQAATLFYRALEGMNERHRAAFILFELEELSGAEIAALQDVAVGTVWVWLHRARAQFLAKLGELERRP
jgi:RNA polymerase sigma-70 factor (ECF subfamily)